MTPAKKSFNVYQGATFKRRLKFKNLDLTGVGVRMQLRDKAGAVLLELSDTNGGAVLTPGVDSFVDLLISDEVTTTLAETSNHDMFLLYATGESDAVLYGQFFVKQRGTQ